MQSYYGHLQRSMCFGQQAQTEENEKIQELWREQQRAKCSNTILNRKSIRSRLVSQPNKKLNLNSEQVFHATDLSTITFSVILPPKLYSKISTNSQINPVDLDENNNSKVHTIKILLDCDASASIICKDVLYEQNKLFKDKKINGQLWQGLLILPS